MRPGSRRTCRLAFDHERIVVVARAARDSAISRSVRLLPPKSTLSHCSAVRTVLERPLRQAELRKKILSMDLLVELMRQKDVALSRQRIYRFDREV